MPDEPSSIRETLHAAAQSAEEPSPATTSVADQPSTPENQSVEKKSAPKESADVADALEGTLLKQFEKELTKLDPQERKTLVKKLASSDRKLQQVSQASAGLRRFAESLSARFPNITAEEIGEALSKHRGTKTSADAKEGDKVLRGIDALIKQTTDPAVREELRESKRVMHEEFEEKLKSGIEDAVKELRQEVSELKSAGLSERSSVVESEIDALAEEEGLPDSFVEKYRDAIRVAAIKYRLPVLEVLPKVVPYADLKAALTEAHPRSSSSSSNGKSNGGGSSSPRSASSASTSSAPANLDQHKDKRGGWDLRAGLKVLAGLGK